MKNPLAALSLALFIAACGANPDPEYMPDADGDDDAAAVEASATVTAEAETTTAAPATTAAAEVAVLSEAETMRLGKEAVALLFAGDMETLWPRLDAQVQEQAVSAENFGDLVGQIFGQIGAEMNVVEEEVIQPPAQRGISVYRRRGHYMAIGQNADLLVAFNADGTIAGINIMPAQ